MSGMNSFTSLSRDSSSTDDFSLNPLKVVISGTTAKTSESKSSENSSSDNLNSSKRSIKQCYSSQIIITADVPNDLLNNLRMTTNSTSRRGVHSASPTPEMISKSTLQNGSDKNESNFQIPDHSYPKSVGLVNIGNHGLGNSVVPIIPPPIGPTAPPNMLEIPSMSPKGDQSTANSSFSQQMNASKSSNFNDSDESNSQAFAVVMANPDLLYPRKNSLPSIQTKNMNSDLTRMNSVPVIPTVGPQQNPPRPPSNPNKLHIPKIPGRTRELSFKDSIDNRLSLPTAPPQIPIPDDSNCSIPKIPTLPKIDDANSITNLYSLPVVCNFNDNKNGASFNFSQKQTPTTFDYDLGSSPPKIPTIPSLTIIPPKGSGSKVPQIPSLPILPPRASEPGIASLPIGPSVPSLPNIPTLTPIDDKSVSGIPQLPTIGSQGINSEMLFRSAVYSSNSTRDYDLTAEKLQIIPPSDAVILPSPDPAVDYPLFPSIPPPGSEPEPTNILLSSSFDQFVGSSCKMHRRTWNVFADRSRPISRNAQQLQVPSLANVQQQTYMSYNPSTQYQAQQYQQQAQPQQQQSYENVPQLLLNSIGNPAQFSQVANANIDYVRQVSTELISQLAKARDHASFQILMQMNVDPSRRDAAGVTPLHYTCFYGMSEMVAELLDKGAKPDEKDSNGARPIDYAISNNFVDIGFVFAERGIMLNIAQAPGYYKMVFDKAQMSGNMLVMDHLVQCGYRPQ